MIVQPSISRVNSSRISIAAGCCPVNLMPRIIIFPQCLPQQFKAMHTPATNGAW